MEGEEEEQQQQALVALLSEAEQQPQAAPAPPPVMMMLSAAERLILSLYDEDDSNMMILREILSTERDDLDIDIALCEAAHDGKVEAVRILFPELSESDKNMYTSTNNGVVQITGGRDHHIRGPLHLAAAHCHVEVVRFLVEDCGVIVNQFDYHAFTPLSVAILNYCGYYECSVPCVPGDSVGAREAHMREWALAIMSLPHEPRSDAREARILETCRLLLEKGADPDHCVQLQDRQLKCYALLRAIESGMLKVVRLLLDHGADPNIDHGRRIERSYGGPSAAPTAISCGQAEIFYLLLERGAVVEPPSRQERTALERTNHPHNVPKTVLFELLQGIMACRRKKLSICRTLMEHATSNEASASLLDMTLEDAMITAIYPEVHADLDFPRAPGKKCCEILFEAGMCPIKALYRAIQDGKQDYCQLLTEHWVENPFEEVNGDGILIDNAAASPVQEAARLEDTGILELFLDHRRDAPNSNSESDDDETGEVSTIEHGYRGCYGLHYILRDPLVSLPAVELLLERETEAALTKAEYDQGPFPVEIAATSGTSLGVIYSLLRPCPHVLKQRRFPHGRPSAGAPDSNSNDDPADDSNSTEDCDEPAKKKRKTTP